MEKRKQLMRHMDGALESVMFIKDCEMLTITEHQKLGDIQDALLVASGKCIELVNEIEARKRESAPILSAYEGPTFSWGEHDTRVRRKRTIKKAEKISLQILELKVAIAEIDEEPD